MLTRRGLIGTLLAAPVIIRTPGLLMPVKAPEPWRLTLDEIQSTMLTHYIGRVVAISAEDIITYHDPGCDIWLTAPSASFRMRLT